MAKPVSLSGIKNNYSRGIVVDFLKFHIKEGSRLSIVSAFFTIYAYDALKDLNQIKQMDFLFGEPRFVRKRYRFLFLLLKRLLKGLYIR